MVFAKTPEAKATLQGGWEQVTKRYEAVVEGRLPNAAGVLESDLDERSPFKVYSAPASDFTRHAITRYRVLDQSRKLSLVELELETGRRHQIRVQLADVGCPIVGDEKYGAKTNPAHRLGLHATGLRFTHPATQEEMSFESPLPKDLARLLRPPRPQA
jgi:23S rRNA pseudouridine1911/1915/1917 synthase